jgi:hypothetical protein
MRYSVFILLFISFFCTNSVLNAQSDSLSTTPINIEVLPENPNPNEPVKITVNSFSTDINSASITWIVNGKISKTGIGEKVFILTVGDTGTNTKLDIVVKTKEGETVNNTLNFSPVAVDLVWQSESFVPPFYKGKAMYSHQNNVTIIAIPHIVSNGKEINPKNLVYSWSKDDRVIESDSGYGKNTFTFEGSLISRPVKVEVRVGSPITGDSGYAHLTMTPTEPTIVFYKKDPLYGIEFQKAIIGDYNIDDINEINVVSIPLFFGVTEVRSTDLFYKWMINGASLNNESGLNSQIFRKKEGVSGKSSISLSIENSNKILQYASENFGLTFNNIKN